LTGLLAKYNIPKRFHATEYWARRRPYHKLTDAEHAAMRSDMCSLLKAKRPIAFGSIISKAAFAEWRLTLGTFQQHDAHHFALDRCLRFLVHGINIYPVDDGVRIICDNDLQHEKLSREMMSWHEARLRRMTRRMPGAPDPKRPLHFSFEQSFAYPGLQAADVIANSALRWGVMDLANMDGEPDFIAGIKPDCPIAIIPLMSKERIAIEFKIRNRPHDEIDE